MALRLLYLCLSTSLLLAAAVAAPSPAPSPDPAPSVIASGSCYKTVKGVPEWCAQMFLKAVFADNKNGVTEECCILLACVREWTCADLLRGFCLPPQVHDCQGSPKRPSSSRRPAFPPAVLKEAAN
jgi:hypothetical protein